MAKTPKLRGRDLSYAYFQIAMGLLGAAMGSTAYKLIHCDYYKKKYRDFYETYDADKDFEEKVAAGVYQNVKPEDLQAS